MVDESPRKKCRPEPGEAAVLRERMRASWPKHVVCDSDEDRESILEMCVEHDAPHDNCALEWWGVNGRIGDNGRFGLFVTFARLAFAGDDEPPNINDPVPYAAAVSWVLVDHETKKYYRFSEVDHQAPLVAACLAANGRCAVDEHFLTALAEQFGQNRLPLPDLLMAGPASVRLGGLDIHYAENQLMMVPQPKGKKKTAFPWYKLHLSGTTFETGGADMREEVKAMVELTLVPTQNPVLHGTDGVLKLGGDWSCDVFQYFTPHCKVVEGELRVIRASDKLEIVRSPNLKGGTMWMDHTFGFALPRSNEEAKYLQAQKECADLCHVWHSFSIQLENGTRDALSVICTVGPVDMKPACNYVVTQCGDTGKSEHHHKDIELNADVTSQFRSEETGTLFATRWMLRTPFRDGAKLEAVIEATFPHQEFVALALQPSCWLGTVRLTGKVIAADGSSIDVTGNGFLKSHGNSSLQKVTKLYSVLREVATAAMEKPSVGAMKSLEEIVGGPAASATSTVRTLVSLQGHSLSDAHMVVFTTFLGAYAFIFHHPKDPREVLETLQWCHGKWLSYFGSISIDVKTLTLRAFVLRELSYVLEKCCASWIPSHVQVIDLVLSPPSSIEALVAVTDGGLAECIVPSDAQFTTHASKLDLSKLKGTSDGTWVLDSSRGTGNIGAFLAAQGVGVMWRTFIENLSPKLIITVDEEQSLVCAVMRTSLCSREHVVRFDGTEWEWHSASRGAACSRACVLQGGAGLCMETTLSSGLMERTWYTFQDDGKTMVETLRLYDTKQSDAKGKGNESDDNLRMQPISVCVRYFILRLDEDAK
ncbi:hypothetical protein DQ04_07631000 [Trypanosoma grayi]|uniref:hypothetical protein n=1 Tax=Trypanosoma grayi TaxID=71804 RepID=UPI0004F47CF7|nr:hypothetical protein DQ04_07631000 [Trypanosoma grayi]KEG08247.1 hypothetical protein DQ04_07631000 [Trypanosoma grayi]